MSTIEPAVSEADVAEAESSQVSPLNGNDTRLRGKRPSSTHPLPRADDPLLWQYQSAAGQLVGSSKKGWCGKLSVVEYDAGPSQPELNSARKACPAAA